MSFEWDIKNDAAIKEVIRMEKEKISIPPALSEKLSPDEEDYLKDILARQLNPTYADLRHSLERELEAFDSWEENNTPGIDWENQEYAKRLHALLNSFTDQKFLKESYFTRLHTVQMYKMLENPVLRDIDHMPLEISTNDLDSMVKNRKPLESHNTYIAKSDDDRWKTLFFLGNDPYVESFADKDMAIAWVCGEFDIEDLPDLLNTTLREYLKNKGNEISLSSETRDAKMAAKRMSYILEGKYER